MKFTYVPDNEVDDMPDSSLDQIGDLGCGDFNKTTAKLELEDGTILYIQTSEWARIYKVIK